MPSQWPSEEGAGQQRSPLPPPPERGRDRLRGSGPVESSAGRRPTVEPDRYTNYGAHQPQPSGLGERVPFRSSPDRKPVSESDAAGVTDAAGAAVGRRAERAARLQDRAHAREIRWQRHRFAVPYRTDGPKLTLGVLWFALLLGATLVSPALVALLAASVAALAALQVAFAWYPRHVKTRWWAAAGAFLAALMGIVGPVGVPVALIVGMAVSAAYAVANPSRSQSTMALMEVAAKAIVPVAVAAASLTALLSIGLGAALVLIVLVSAYEVGDFLVGSGSSNAVEGPISGMVSMAAVVFILWVVTPAPFTSTSIVLFGALTATGCILGQVLASAILPKGAAWAPALRRLDSYLLVAPLWVLLLGSVPTTTTL